MSFRNKIQSINRYLNMIYSVYYHKSKVNQKSESLMEFACCCMLISELLTSFCFIRNVLLDFFVQRQANHQNPVNLVSIATVQDK